MSNEYDGDIYGEEPQLDQDEFDNDAFVDGGTRDDVRIIYVSYATNNLLFSFFF